MVRYLTPNSTLAEIIWRKFSVPARWPDSLGRPRDCAQRPFPSIIIATCLGILSPEVQLESFMDQLDFHDLLFFFLTDLANILNETIGHFLKIFLSSFQ